MKTFLALLIMSFSFSAFAAPYIKCAKNPKKGIGIDHEYIEKQVLKMQSCSEASRIVESCGAGSSMDAMTTAAAIGVCDKLTGALSAADQDLKERMSNRCDSVCDRQTDGTMCISQQSFCRLSVSKFMNSVSSSQN